MNKPKIDRSYRYGLFIRGGWGSIPMGYTMVPNFITRHYGEVLTLSQRAIMDCLFRHKKEDPSAVCNPSLPTIMRETKLPNRRIRKDIEIMETKKFIEVKREFGKNNEYNFEPFIVFMEKRSGLDMREPRTSKDLENENLATEPMSLQNTDPFKTTPRANGLSGNPYKIVPSV